MLSVSEAQREYASFTQEQVDKIFRARRSGRCRCSNPSRQMAVAESGMGIVEDKVIKTTSASEYIYNAYKDEKPCGVLSEDDTFGTITLSLRPIGIICGIVPTTNPTSTAIFKSLISLRKRVTPSFSLPHPRVQKKPPTKRLISCCRLRYHRGRRAEGPGLAGSISRL
ncbi:hypothetical protein LN650_12815 [Klebsiella pneumoniae subsp. pneumoniae]|nr:hypothetical protein [Klebsiella pneumoniae subsp. pneumoniae]